MRRHAVSPASRLLPGARLAALVALAVSTACGLSYEPRVYSPVLLVRVRNDLAPAGSVSVWLIPEGHTRHEIGAVAPGTERLLLTNTREGAPAYRLLADHPWSAEVTSGPFEVRGAALVDWDLATNAITLHGPHSSEQRGADRADRGASCLPSPAWCRSCPASRWDSSRCVDVPRP